jgi:hypothetical protein
MNEEIKGKRIAKMKPLYFKQLMGAIGLNISLQFHTHEYF